ncbi:MAG: YqgE/AlgH family protein [Verrucomicrobia bacterium]|nr:MAG: YqgE/AlgH family protein [Verrucomicrobiota bacterium]
MSRRIHPKQDLAGSLLLAHPEMVDPNFRRTVVLLSAHNEDGALGVILNRPVGKSLGEYGSDFSTGLLSDVPVFTGGPVNDKQIILSAWHAESSLGMFRLYFGIDPEKAKELIASPEGLDVRAFVGHAGWGEGQLEVELEQNAWIVSPVAPDLINQLKGVDLWRTIMGNISPELRFLADAPDDPSVN